MELDALQALLLVAEHGSFQSAARSGGVSRSTLRHRVERLERDLGTPLLVCNAVGVSLTPGGQEVVTSASAVLREVTALRARVIHATDQVASTMRLVIPSGLPTPFRARALRALRILAPGLSLGVREVEEALSVLHQDFDLLLTFGDPPGRPGWFMTTVGRFELGLFATRTYLDREGAPSDLDDAVGRPLLMWEVPGRPRGGGLPLRQGGEAAVAPWVRTTNLALLHELADDALLYGPDLPLLCPEDKPLVRVLPEQVYEAVTARAVSPNPGRLDPRIRAFLDNLRTLASDSPRAGA